MNISSGDFLRNEDEFIHAKLNSIKSVMVNVPRVEKSPIQMECKYYTTVKLPVNAAEDINTMIIGSVEGIHLDSNILKNESIDLDQLQPIARLGKNEYITFGNTNVFIMNRPQQVYEKI